MINKKVIILVMCSSNNNYRELENCIKETWFNLKNDDVEIIFYSDNTHIDNKSSYPVLINNDLILPCNDGAQNCGVKTIMALDWVTKNYKFDYIYRSNLGAYVDIENLLSFLIDKPKVKFYSGTIGVDEFYLGRKVRFASGSGYFLSSDLVELILENIKLWNHSAIDDVALGDLMERLGIDIDTSAKRMNICSGVTDYNIGAMFVDDIPDNEIYHIRLRSDNRDIDIQNMKMLYEKKRKEKCTN